MTERINRALTNMLAMYVDSDHKNWHTILPFVTYAFNTATHETTGYSPFFLLYARPPRYTLDTILPFSTSGHICITETLCVAEEALRIARLWSIASQERFKARYVSYAPGDTAWLWRPIRCRGLHQKLLAYYDGPYVVVARISDVTYQIARLTATGRCSRKTELSHVAYLKRFHSSEIPQ